MGLHGRGNVTEVTVKGRTYYQAAISENGKRSRKTFKSKREADLWLKTKRSEVAQGLPLGSSNETVAAYLQRWLSTAQTRVKPATLRTYDLNVRRVLPHLGKKKLGDLTGDDVDACYSALLKAGLSERSVKQVHEMFHAALKAAVQKRLITFNPADQVLPPRPRPKDIEPPGKDVIQRLIAGTKGEPLHALWALLPSTGLRMGEALGLQWGDIDWQGAQLSVLRAVQWQKGKGMVVVPVKTERSKRPVPLVESMVAILREHYLANGRPDAGVWVFQTSAGTPYQANNTWRVLQRTLDRFGLPHCRQHDFRHAFASTLSTSNANMQAIQQLMGHSTYEQTANRYAHLAPSAHREAIAHVAGFFPTGGESEQVS